MPAIIVNFGSSAFLISSSIDNSVPFGELGSTGYDMATLCKLSWEVFQAPFWIMSGLLSRKSTRKGLPPLYLFGFSKWKTFMCEWFPNHRLIFVPMKVKALEFDLKWRWRILEDPRSEVLTWQYKGPTAIKAFCQRHGVPFHFVEDGFIRSVELGALHTPPISLVFDRLDMHFNAQTSTDLENILSTYDFDADARLMPRARQVITKILAAGLSKYNASAPIPIESIYGPKTKERVLVLGQVERDASIAYGSLRRYTNNEVVELASRENPHAQIIYKPHPEVLRGIAEPASDPASVSHLAQILTQDVSLADSFKTIDRVYTITSLAGFEALLHGLKVTTVGCPFYSGWGLTDDRQSNDRRRRKLTIEQIFAAAYILYPRYFDPYSKRPIEIEDALEILIANRDK